MKRVAIRNGRMLLAAMTLPLAACGDSGTPPQPTASVTDSAGVRLVTSEPGDAVYAELAEAPALSVGLLDGPPELLFGRIASVARDEDGNLVVADGQANEIRIFDPRGTHLRTLGGEGEGPGEFERLGGAWPVAGGGIVAIDSNLERVTSFDPDGATEGTATFAGQLIDEAGFTDIDVIGLGGPATVLSKATLTRVPSLASGRGTMETVMEEMFSGEAPISYVRHRFDGTLVDSLAAGRDAATSLSMSGSGGGWQMSIRFVPFSPESAATGSAHGVVVAGGVQYEISVFDPEGALRMRARLTEAPPAVTDDHLRAYATSSGTRERDEAEIRGSIERYREMPLPESLPGYTDVVIADTGEIWARRYSVRGAARVRWDVFAADGGYLGRVEVPGSFRIEEVGRGQVLGIATDDLGVERAQLRELTFR